MLFVVDGIYVRCCFAVFMLFSLLYYVFVRLSVMNVLTYVCAVFLSRGFLVSAIFLNIVSRLQIDSGDKECGCACLLLALLTNSNRSIGGF